jgi:hypothetical protein
MTHCPADNGGAFSFMDFPRVVGYPDGLASGDHEMARGRKWWVSGAPLSPLRVLAGHECEPVSVDMRTRLRPRGQNLPGKGLREPETGRRFGPAKRPSQRRDGNRRSGLRKCRGKPGVLSETAGNRICAGLGGGRTRTRTLDPLIKSQLLTLQSTRPRVRSILRSRSNTTEVVMAALEVPTTPTWLRKIVAIAAMQLPCRLFHSAWHRF